MSACACARVPRVIQCVYVPRGPSLTCPSLSISRPSVMGHRGVSRVALYFAQPLVCVCLFCFLGCLVEGVFLWRDCCFCFVFWFSLRHWHAVVAAVCFERVQRLKLPVTPQWTPLTSTQTHTHKAGRLSFDLFHCFESVAADKFVRPERLGPNVTKDLLLFFSPPMFLQLVLMTYVKAMFVIFRQSTVAGYRCVYCEVQSA